MQIIEIRKNDLESLRNLFLKERQRTFSWLDTSKYQLEDFDKLTQGELVLAAFIDNVLVGFISIWIPNNFIHHLYIDQKFQGQNIGTALLQEAIKKTSFPITLKCLENNVKAVNFYNRKGFIQKNTGNSEHGIYILFELNENVQ